MRDQFLKTLVEAMNDNEDIVYLTADCGDVTKSKDYQGKPERSINVGIAEQSLMSIAAGMAKEGKIAVVQSIGNFPTLRCLEQIRDDVCYHHFNVKICSIGGGLSYGPAGVTHHSTEDFSIMRSLPGMTCFAPGDAYEVEACVRLMLETEGPCYMRIGYRGEPLIHAQKIKVLQLGEILNVIEGERIAIITAGNILSEAKKAAELLRTEGLNPGLYSCPTLKPINQKQLQQIAEDYDQLITVEENVLEGGFGAMILEQLNDLNLHKPIERIGLSGFPTVIGSREYLRAYYHLDAASLAKHIVESFADNPHL